MNRRVAVDLEVLTLLMSSSSFASPAHTAHLGDTEIAFMELDDNEFINFNHALLLVSPIFIRSVVGITLNDGTVVVSWYYTLGE